MTVGVIRTGTSAAIGTGVTKTKISPTSGLFMPADGKALLTIKPMATVLLTTTVQTVAVRCDVESADVRNLGPFEVLMAPFGDSLTAGSPFIGMEEYKFNAPLFGGEALNVYATALVANTADPEAMAYVTVSNDGRDLIHPLTHQMMTQRHAKLGTATAAGIVEDTDIAGTKYSFSGGKRIIELFGEHIPGTVAANDALLGGIKYTSSEFVDSIPQELPLYPWAYGVGATGSILIPGVSRQKVNIPVKPGQVNIQDYFNAGVLPAAATAPHYFVDGVIYE